MPENPSALSVTEIGSVFVGSRIHHLESLPKGERIRTPGGPVASYSSQGLDGVDNCDAERRRSGGNQRYCF
jgi:hypothetical protein